MHFTGKTFLNCKFVKYPIPAREPQIKYPNPLNENDKYPEATRYPKNPKKYYPNPLDTRRFTTRHITTLEGCLQMSDSDETGF